MANITEAAYKGLMYLAVYFCDECSATALLYH